MVVGGEQFSPSADAVGEPQKLKYGVWAKLDLHGNKVGKRKKLKVSQGCLMDQPLWAD